MRVAVCQVNSRHDRSANLVAARDLLERAAAAGADLAVLPEYVDYLGPADGEPAPEAVDGDFAASFAEAARRLRMWVVAGSFHEVGPDEKHTYNTSLVFDRDGRTAATYRKIHLFDVDLADGTTLRESASREFGGEIATADLGFCKAGLSVCYDLRFPELYRGLANAGVDLIFVPSAFTAYTGQAHWEALLRARAIENQVYVIAPDQFGKSPRSFETHGHSMIVDPWGKILAERADGAGVIGAEVDLDYIARIRAELPVLKHRRL